MKHYQDNGSITLKPTFLGQIFIKYYKATEKKGDTYKGRICLEADGNTTRPTIPGLITHLCRNWIRLRCQKR